ncbi:MAG TPA: hypothetical protein VF039_14645 [Longimicrobiales bacterium]
MHAASKPNPALEAFRVLIGEWRTTATHPMLPGVTVQGRATFEWLEGGAFMITRSRLDDPRFPGGVSIFGTDDSSGECFMLYFDERNVSRKYDVRLEGSLLTWWRDNPALSQRFTFTIAEDGDEIVGHGRMSQNQGAWEDDLQIVYTRIRERPRGAAGA